MKRFVWPLQRVLDVTVQRERVVRSELLALAQRISRMRQRVIQRRAALRSLFSDIADATADVRISLQAIVMNSSAHVAREIDELQLLVEELTQQRSAKSAELIKFRKKQETLEKMRQQARQEHLREQVKQEQKQFDENAQMAFISKAMLERPSQFAGA